MARRRVFALVLFAVISGALLNSMTGITYGAGSASGPERDSPAARPGDDESDRVDQGPQGAGRARHPLFVKVQGVDSRGNHLVTNTIPHGYTPAQVRHYLGLTGDGSGQTIA